MKFPAWLRRAWKSRRADTASDPTPLVCPASAGPTDLERLPDDAMALVLALLSTSDVRGLVMTSKALATNAAVSAAFRQCVQLVVPPDDARNGALMAALTDLPTQLLPATFTVETLDSLHALRRVGDSVLALTLQQEWCVWPPSPTATVTRQPPRPLRSFDLAPLSPGAFSHLVDLEISLLARHSLDLEEIHECAPRLERLCLRETAATRNRHVLRQFTGLRVLELRPRRDHDTGARNVDINLEDLVGMPQLEELHIDNQMNSERIRNAHMLAHVHPLRVLWVCGKWDEAPSDDALRVHLSTLRELRLPYTNQWSASVLAEGTNLRVLKASINFDNRSDATVERRFQALPLHTLTVALMSRLDLAFLPTLALLENLTISVSLNAHDCCALRGFTNLKTLGLRGGCVRDFIAHLPKLRVLKCTGSTRRPQFMAPETPLEGFVSPVRRAVLDLFIELTPFALTVLQHVEELVICVSKLPDCLPTLWRLTNVKRLFVELYCCGPRFLCDLVDCFESLDKLEDLHVQGHDCNATSLIVPPSLVRARRLRVLDLCMPSPIKTLAKLKGLEVLYIRGWMKFNAKALLGLHNLREISLPLPCSCQPLRKARGPGGSLPSLLRILHPAVDCLLTGTCMAHESPLTIKWRMPDFPKWAGDLDSFRPTTE